MSASVKNWSAGRRCNRQRASPSGYKPAVNDMLPRSMVTSGGNHRPKDTRRRKRQAVAAEGPLEHYAGLGHVVVVHPRDAVPGQHVEDRPRGWVVDQVERQVIDEAVGGPGDQETPVGECRAEARAEPVVGERECLGQPVVEGQVLLGPVAHRHRGVQLGHQRLRTGHESVARAAASLQLAGVPTLGRHLLRLHGGLLVIRGDRVAATAGVGNVRRAVRFQRESLAAPGEHAEVVVVGVVLHHQHDDVLYLRDKSVPARPVRPGPRARPSAAVRRARAARRPLAVISRCLQRRPSGASQHAAASLSRAHVAPESA